MRSINRDFLNFYRMSTSQRSFALASVAERAEAAKEGRILALVRKALAHEEGVQLLERCWSKQAAHEVQHGPLAQKLDREVDQVLRGIKRVLDGQRLISTEGSPEELSSKRLADHFFPLGLARLTKADFVEQFSQIRHILKVLEDDPQSDADIDRFKLRASVQKLTTLWKDFGQEIQAAERRMSYDELRRARARGEALLGDVIVAILALHYDEEGPALALRESLLEPIERQNDRLKKFFRQRRKGGSGEDTETTIEPEIGDLEDEDEEEGSQAA